MNLATPHVDIGLTDRPAARIRSPATGWVSVRAFLITSCSVSFDPSRPWKFRNPSALSLAALSFGVSPSDVHCIIKR